MTKTFFAAAAATALIATSASANFSFNEMNLAGSTAELGQVSVESDATVSVYSYNAGVQGALLGETELNAGANRDVRVPLGKRPINDVIAVLTVDGQVIDTQEIDLAR